MHDHCLKEARGLVVAVAFFAAPGFISHAVAEKRSFLIDLNSKQAIDLGSLGGGHTYARDINDAGQVVGSSRTTQGETYAFLTGPDGMGMNRVGMSTYPLFNSSNTAVGINNAGQVIGNYSATSDPEGFYTWTHSFITGPNGVGTTELGFEATGINDRGLVVGWSFPEQPFSSIYPAVVFTGTGRHEGTYKLSELLGPFSYGDEFTAVNNSGQAVGSAYPPGYFVRHAIFGYLDTPPGFWTDIGALAAHSTSQAVGINDAGQAVGWYQQADRIYHAFITNASATELIDLVTPGGYGSQAFGINDAGQVVGWFATAEGNHHAFVTGHNGEGMTDLDSLIDLPKGVSLTEATGINNNGQIIALGVVPEPESYALMLAGLALMGTVVWRKQRG
jgi:probable HAF family extracellular repeat protein